MLKCRLQLFKKSENRNLTKQTFTLTGTIVSSNTENEENYRKQLSKHFLSMILILIYSIVSGQLTAVPEKVRYKSERACDNVKNNYVFEMFPRDSRKQHKHV